MNTRIVINEVITTQCFSTEYKIGKKDYPADSRPGLSSAACLDRLMPRRSTCTFPLPLLSRT